MIAHPMSPRTAGRRARSRRTNSDLKSAEPFDTQALFQSSCPYLPEASRAAWFRIAGHSTAVIQIGKDGRQIALLMRPLPILGRIQHMITWSRRQIEVDIDGKPSHRKLPENADPEAGRPTIVRTGREGEMVGPSNHNPLVRLASKTRQSSDVVDPGLKTISFSFECVNTRSPISVTYIGNGEIFNAGAGKGDGAGPRQLRGDLKMTTRATRD
jgi:hypothetical protein